MATDITRTAMAIIPTVTDTVPAITGTERVTTATGTTERYYGSSYYRGYGYNSRRSSVGRLQQQLARAGYYRGPIDGIMGRRTRYALRAYQHDHGSASL